MDGIRHSPLLLKVILADCTGKPSIWTVALSKPHEIAKLVGSFRAIATPSSPGIPHCQTNQWAQTHVPMEEDKPYPCSCPRPSQGHSQHNHTTPTLLVYDVSFSRVQTHTHTLAFKHREQHSTTMHPEADTSNFILCISMLYQLSYGQIVTNDQCIYR